MIKVERNEETGILEAHIPAKLTNLGISNRENVNGTKWGLATALVTYPDDTTEEVQACMWDNSRPQFTVGQNVILRTQIEGDEKTLGNAVVQLTGATRVDISKFAFAETGAVVATEA